MSAISVFDFGALTNDGDGSITGITNNDYFTLTARSDSELTQNSDFSLETTTSSGRGGSLQKWDSNSCHR